MSQGKATEEWALLWGLLLRPELCSKDFIRIRALLSGLLVNAEICWKNFSYYIDTLRKCAVQENTNRYTHSPLIVDC